MASIFIVYAWRSYERIRMGTYGGNQVTHAATKTRLDQAGWSGESVTFTGTTYILLILWWLASDFIGLICVAYRSLRAVLFV